MRLVPVAEADLEAVAGLVNRAFSTYSHIFKGQRTSARDYADEVGEDARVLLLEDSGKLLATAMVANAGRFIEPRSAGTTGSHPWTGALYLGLVGVEPSSMNTGLGRRMVRYVEDFARTEGFPSVALSTVREFGLVDYYEKLNYQVVHEVTFPVGHWDFVVPHNYCEMVKHL